SCPARSGRAAATARSSRTPRPRASRRRSPPTRSAGSGRRWWRPPPRRPSRRRPGGGRAAGVRPVAPGTSGSPWPGHGLDCRLRCRPRQPICRLNPPHLASPTRTRDHQAGDRAARTPSTRDAPVDEEDAMAQERTGAVTFKGNPLTLVGPDIRSGQAAPDFTAIDNGLQPVRLSQARGKVVILSAVPSLDTPVCDTETRRFNEEASRLGEGVEVWTISMDLPFAQKRWCGAAGVSRVKTLSDFRDRAFGQAYGTQIKDGPL